MSSSVLAQGIMGLVVACRQYPNDVVKELMPFLHPGHSFVVFSPYKEVGIKFIFFVGILPMNFLYFGFSYWCLNFSFAILIFFWKKTKQNFVLTEVVISFKQTSYLIIIFWSFCITYSKYVISCYNIMYVILHIERWLSCALLIVSSKIQYSFLEILFHMLIPSSCLNFLT